VQEEDQTSGGREVRGDEKRRLGVSHGNPLMNILKEPPPLRPPARTHAAVLEGEGGGAGWVGGVGGGGDREGGEGL